MAELNADTVKELVDKEVIGVVGEGLFRNRGLRGIVKETFPDSGDYDIEQIYNGSSSSIRIFPPFYPTAHCSVVELDAKGKPVEIYEY